MANDTAELARNFKLFVQELYRGISAVRGKRRTAATLAGHS